MRLDSTVSDIWPVALLFLSVVITAVGLVSFIITEVNAERVNTLRFTISVPERPSQTYKNCTNVQRVDGRITFTDAFGNQQNIEQEGVQIINK